MLILDKFFLKYEGGTGNLTPRAPPTPPSSKNKTTLKKPSRIRVKIKILSFQNPASVSKSNFNLKS